MSIQRRDLFNHYVPTIHRDCGCGSGSIFGAPAGGQRSCLAGKQRHVVVAPHGRQDLLAVRVLENAQPYKKGWRVSGVLESHKGAIVRTIMIKGGFYVERHRWKAREFCEIAVDLGWRDIPLSFCPVEDVL